MAEVIVSIAFDKLNSMLRQDKEQGFRLLDCVDEEFRKFIKNTLAIRDVLEDAEMRQVKDTAVGDWLKRVKTTFYDIEETLDEWTTAIQKLQIKEDEDDNSNQLRKVCSSIHSFFFCNRRVLLHGDIGLKIRYVNKTLDDVTMEIDKFNFKLLKGKGELKEKTNASFIANTLKVYGRDQDKATILKFLVDESNQATILPIISIVGLEGIGKTTLARLVFDDDRVNLHFNQKIWVCAYPFNEIKVAKTILECLKTDASNCNELEILLQLIRQSIKGKKFLLVLDDVDTIDAKYWKQLNYALKSGLEGSRILVTLCGESVIDSTKMISLNPLSMKDCLSLFNQIAFLEGPSDKEHKILNDIGQKLISKFDGLPLRVKILGGLLHFKTDVIEWQSILDSKIWKLEEAEVGPLFPLLLLSYYNFPSILRKCFSYCAIFPKNYEIEKDQLVKLWMSQSYLIKTEEKMDHMELIGEEYLYNLAMRSFIQDFQINEYDGSLISFKMHNTVSKFARFLTKSECFHKKVKDSESNESEVNIANIDVRHLMITFESDNSSFPNEVYDKGKLRSLVLEPRGGFVSNIALSKLFDQLTCLRALDLSNQDNFWYKLIKKIPSDIEKLVHLRYLNLSKNKRIKELPETLCELCNLQTLELSWCTNLKNLPQGMKKLINLRHLVNHGTSLSYLPEGMEKLTRLRTLSEFIVCRSGSKGCALESLENLNHLQGFLSIKKLGNEKLGNEKLGNEKDERKKVETAAILRNKESLLDLYLCFKEDEEILTTDKNDDEKVLKALETPPNLERLKIFYYRAKVLPSNWVQSLTKLKFMSLDRCKNIEYLPPLGSLPSLESLFIRSLNSVERVSNEFLGLKSTDSKSSSVAFPKLKNLEFHNMKEWNEWQIVIPKGNISIMPCIQSLTITFCPKLERLPFHNMKEWNEGKIGIPKGNISIMPCIQFLTNAFCPKLEPLPDDISKLQSLKELKIIPPPITPDNEEKVKKAAE